MCAPPTEFFVGVESITVVVGGVRCRVNDRLHHLRRALETYAPSDDAARGGKVSSTSSNSINDKHPIGDELCQSHRAGTLGMCG